MKINIIIGVILSLISLFLIALILFRKNEPFFNCRKIIQDHFDLFSGCRSQYFVFYILPIFLSARRPKRISLPQTEKSIRLSLISGGSTRIPRCEHSAMYSATLV